MADPVNLNHVRKARAKAEAEARAAANRVKHGRTLAEKRSDRAAETRRQALLDGARMEGTSPDGAGPDGARPGGAGAPARPVRPKDVPGA